MAQWNLDYSHSIERSSRNLEKSPDFINKIDSKIFESFYDSPDLNRFFKQASNHVNIEKKKISQIKKKISKVCEQMISISKEAFCFLEEGNTLQVLKKKSEFKPEFLRGVWKNYKKFMEKGFRNAERAFQTERDFNIVVFVERYLETCLLNLKFFFVHLYEMATKFYAKRRTNQVSWNSQRIPFGEKKKRKFSCEELDSKNLCRRHKRGKQKEDSADLSKSVTSESMSPEMMRNKMETQLSKLLSMKFSKREKEGPNWLKKINQNESPESESWRERGDSEILKEVCLGLKDMHYSQNPNNQFVIANCEGFKEEGGLEIEKEAVSGSPSLDFEILKEDNLRSMQDFLIENNENFLATRKPSWLDNDQMEAIRKEEERRREGEKREENVCKKIKRRKWLEEENEILMAFLREIYPKAVSSSKIVELANKLNRSKSSISNRLRILKKNRKKELEQIAEKMIGSALSKAEISNRQTLTYEKKSKENQLKIEEEATKPSEANLKRKTQKGKQVFPERYFVILETFKAIEPFISGEERSFNEIQTFLKVETESQFSTLVDHLEELKQMCKLRSREAVFILVREVVVKALRQKKENFWPENGYSAILDFIFTSFYHKNFVKMSLRELKEKVIGQFNFDVQVESFDEQLLQYLRQSQYFLFSRKEVFFI